MEISLKEIRNSKKRLLCKVNEITGEIEIQGAHHSSYMFVLPIGHTFTVIRDNLKSSITRNATKFTVIDCRIIA